MSDAPRKPRKDSKIASLAPAIKSAVNDMLMRNCGIDDVRDYLQGKGVKISGEAISNYYRYHILPHIRQANADHAAIINRIPQGDLDDATYSATKQQLYTLLTTPGANPKIVKIYHDMIIKATKQRLDARKIAILEDKLASAKAVAEQALDGARKGLTDETIADIQEKLKLL